MCSNVLNRDVINKPQIACKCLYWIFVGLCGLKLKLYGRIKMRFICFMKWINNRIGKHLDPVEKIFQWFW